MRLLLDTHAFLWFILDDPQLSTGADASIADPTNQIEISPTSYWEIAIKISIGKYSLPEPFAVFMEREIRTKAPKTQRSPRSARCAYDWSAAGVAELVDAPDLGSGGATRAGSSPAARIGAGQGSDGPPLGRKPGRGGVCRSRPDG